MSSKGRKEWKSAGTLKKWQKLNTQTKSTHVDDGDWDEYGRRRQALHNWKRRRQLGFGKSRRSDGEHKKLDNGDDKHGASNTVAAPVVFPAGQDDLVRCGSGEFSRNWPVAREKHKPRNSTKIGGWKFLEGVRDRNHFWSQIETKNWNLVSIWDRKFCSVSIGDGIFAPVSIIWIQTISVYKGLETGIIFSLKLRLGLETWSQLETEKFVRSQLETDILVRSQ